MQKLLLETLPHHQFKKSKAQKIAPPPEQPGGGAFCRKRA